MSHNFTQPEEIDYLWMTEGQDTGADTGISEGTLSGKNAVARDEFAAVAQDNITTPRISSWRTVNLESY